MAEVRRLNYPRWATHNPLCTIVILCGIKRHGLRKNEIIEKLSRSKSLFILNIRVDEIIMGCYNSGVI